MTMSVSGTSPLDPLRVAQAPTPSAPDALAPAAPVAQAPVSPALPKQTGDLRTPGTHGAFDQVAEQVSAESPKALQAFEDTPAAPAHPVAVTPQDTMAALGTPEVRAVVQAQAAYDAAKVKSEAKRAELTRALAVTGAAMTPAQREAFTAKFKRDNPAIEALDAAQKHLEETLAPPHQTALATYAATMPGSPAGEAIIKAARTLAQTSSHGTAAALAAEVMQQTHIPKLMDMLMKDVVNPASARELEDAYARHPSDPAAAMAEFDAHQRQTFGKLADKFRENPNDFKQAREQFTKMFESAANMREFFAHPPPNPAGAFAAMANGFKELGPIGKSLLAAGFLTLHERIGTALTEGDYAAVAKEVLGSSKEAVEVLSSTTRMFEGMVTKYPAMAGKLAGQVLPVVGCLANAFSACSKVEKGQIIGALGDGLAATAIVAACFVPVLGAVMLGVGTAISIGSDLFEDNKAAREERAHTQELLEEVGFEPALATVLANNPPGHIERLNQTFGLVPGDVARLASAGYTRTLIDGSQNFSKTNIETMAGMQRGRVGGFDAHGWLDALNQRYPDPAARARAFESAMQGIHSVNYRRTEELNKREPQSAAWWSEQLRTFASPPAAGTAGKDPYWRGRAMLLQPELPAVAQLAAHP